MHATQPTTEILQDAFRTLALQLGGIIHLHTLDDETAWALARVVDKARRKALQSVTTLSDMPVPAAPAKHPSITYLINCIETN